MKGGCTLEKQEVCKSDMFDLRVNFFQLDPKSRANHLDHFRTLIITSFGLGIAKNLRGVCTLNWAQLVRNSLIMVGFKVDLVKWHRERT